MTSKDSFAFLCCISIVIISTLLSLTSCAPVTSHSTQSVAPKCQQIDGRADARCNPGKIANTPEVLADAPLYRKTLCAPSDNNPQTPTWVQARRPPSSYTERLKRQQMIEYGLTENIKLYDEDHIVSLALDGSPSDPVNLFPQRENYSKEKDKEERLLWRQVCSGATSLHDAQQYILRDWVR